jgi:hypothetical protein
VGGGRVQFGPLGTAATNRPIVPAPGDYDDGEIGGMIGRGNRSTRRKPASVSLCPPQIPHADRTRTWAAAVGSQRTNRLSYGSAFPSIMQQLFMLNDNKLNIQVTKISVKMSLKYAVSGYMFRSL